jgi:hypothetical protein
MRQFLKSGSARGVRSNPHPYRDPRIAFTLELPVSVGPKLLASSRDSFSDCGAKCF